MKNTLLFLLSLQFCSMAMAQTDTEYTQKSLKHIVGIGVSVTRLSSYAIKDGLSRSLILNDVESHLRMAGIKVLTDKEIVSAPGMPTLDVQVSVTPSDGLSICFIEVRVMQWVMLQRDPQSVCAARTWSTEMLTIGEVINLQSYRQTLKELADKFIIAYLSVNPKN